MKLSAQVTPSSVTGWKDSFFGDLHGRAQDSVEFFTQKKVVVERWPKTWSRQF